MKLIDSIKNMMNKINNPISEKSQLQYNDLVKSCNDLYEKESLLEKKEIYEKILKELSEIDAVDLHKILEKSAKRNGYGYDTQLGWCMETTAGSLIKRYTWLNEKNNDYIHNLNIFNDIISKTKKHQIIIGDDSIQKRNLQDMENVNLKTITKRFNREQLVKYVVIDVETTGLKAQSDEIIELSAIKVVDGDPVEYFSTLIKPRKKITEEITAINHITNDMVENAPSIEQVKADFEKFVSGYNIVGHNIMFDLKFLHCNGFNILDQKGIKIYDTLELSKKAFKDLDDYKLDSICKNNLQIMRNDAHRSLSDSFVTYLLFEQCIEIILNG